MVLGSCSRCSLAGGLGFRRFRDLGFRRFRDLGFRRFRDLGFFRVQGLGCGAWIQGCRLWRVLELV